MTRRKLTSIDDTLSQDGAKLRHDVFMLIHDDLSVQCPEVLHPGAGCFSLLDQDHRGGYQSSLANEVYWIDRSSLGPVTRWLLSNLYLHKRYPEPSLHHISREDCSFLPRGIPRWDTVLESWNRKGKLLLGYWIRNYMRMRYCWSGYIRHSLYIARG